MGYFFIALQIFFSERVEHNNLSTEIKPFRLIKTIENVIVFHFIGIIMERFDLLAEILRVTSHNVTHSLVYVFDALCSFMLKIFGRNRDALI